MAPEDNDWNQPQKFESETEADSDWSTPEHSPPPGDDLPQTYQEKPPASSLEADLTSEDILAIVAAVIPGVGQMLLGQTVKGLVMLGIAVFTCGGFGLFAVASIVDAYLVARAKKHRPIGEWEFFPDFQEAFNI